MRMTFNKRKETVMDDHKNMFGRDEPGPSKKDLYNWKIKDAPGVFMEISKLELNIDHNYQRDNVSNDRVLGFAREWSWAACGTLGVAMRSDQTFWVFDGQHRLLGALKRSDIDTLPCMVFEVLSQSSEATHFLGANTNRGPVSTYHKFKAMLAAHDAEASDIERIIGIYGYRIGKCSANKTVHCIAAITGEYRRDKNVMESVFGMMAKICDGGPINNQIFGGLCYLEGFLRKLSRGSLADKDNTKTLLQAGPGKLLNAITSAVAFHHGSGAKVWADGIANLMNYKKKTRKIPSPFSNSDSAEGEPDA